MYRLPSEFGYYENKKKKIMEKRNNIINKTSKTLDTLASKMADLTDQTITNTIV